MKVFIWYVEKCSDNYHSGGGVVVFAESEDEARSLANAEEHVVVPANLRPDFVLQPDNMEPRVLVFPDAGCC